MVFSNSFTSVVVLISVILSTVAAKLVDNSVLNDNPLESNSVNQYVAKLEHEIKRLKEDSRKDRLRMDDLENQLKLLVQSLSKDPPTNADSPVDENPSELKIQGDATIRPTIRKY